MKLVSLTIPKPTLNNENEVRSISLTIKSKNNVVQVIDTWPFALPRYKYELDDILEISIYYTLKNKNNTSNSEEINLYSVVYFPCILLKDTDISGKKQWILGFEKFDESDNFLTEINIENALKQIRIMEEKARKSFKISKIYLIFYSCNRTVMNIEEQLNNYNSADQSYFSERIFPTECNKKKDNQEKSNKSYIGIRPEDSISRISGKTGSTNNINRVNLIKQSLSDNCDKLSDAIEMINKYRNKSKNSLTTVNCNQNNNKDTVLTQKMLNLKNIPDNSNFNEKIVKKNDIDSKEISINIKSIKSDAATIISKAVSSNTKNLLEKKIQQEKLLVLQYYFSIWRQKTQRKISIRIQKHNDIKMRSIYKLSQIIEKIQNCNKLNFLSSLKKNCLLINCERKMNDLSKEYKFENQQLKNEKNILSEKLNSLIVENNSKLQLLKDNLFAKEKEIFELKKKIEFINNLNNDLNERLVDKNMENEKLSIQLKEVRNYLNNIESIVENDKNKHEKEKRELDNIINEKKKENSKQLEKINLLSNEIVELKNVINIERNNKNKYLKLNDELNSKYKIIENEKLQLIDEFNQIIYNKNKENDDLKVEKIKYEEDNDSLIKSNSKLQKENDNYKTICNELVNEKNSLINSVYDLINQIEDEKIERIQELENSRILFQSINNNNIRNICNVVDASNYKEDIYSIYDQNDLKLEDLKNTYDSKPKLSKVHFSVININDITILDENCDKSYGDYILILNNEYKSIKERLLKNNSKYKKFSKVNINEIQIINQKSNVSLSIKKELELEFLSEINNEFIKEKNEKIMDLSERVRILTEEMNKLKDNEPIKENNRLENEYFNKNLSLDDTEKIVSSATEMFMLALKNIKLNSDKTDIEEKEIRNQIIIPSEFSFNVNNVSNEEDNNKLDCNNQTINVEMKYRDQSNQNYHQYDIEHYNNSVNKISNKLIPSSTLTTSSSISPSVISPKIQTKDVNQLNRIKNQVMSISSPSATPILSRSNSMRQNFNNNNINGFYYQYNPMEYNTFIPKRYNSLPKQNNFYPMRTIPPPFFPKS